MIIYAICLFVGLLFGVSACPGRRDL